MKTLSILAAAVLATVAAAAYAAPYGPGAGTPDCPAYGAGHGMRGPGMRGAAMLERMKAADTDANGLLSREEVQAAMPGLAARFDTIDADRDGNITLAEMQAARGAFRGARGEGWKKWDANGDGQLSRDEVAGAPRLSQEFDAIDADSNGLLTVEELQAARGQVGGRGWGRRS